MTREEAIEVLQEKIDNRPLFKDEREAFELAIFSLSAPNDAIKTDNEVIDLISRAEALETIHKSKTKECARWGIQELPSVSAERSGEWIERINYGMTCSVCGAYFDYCDNNTEMFFYCPSCGAKMKGGK